MSAPFNIAKSFVRLREVTDGVAGLDLGRKHLEYRSILTVNCLNFSLMSEKEQDGVIEGFKGFLNGLSFPIQILIRNLPYDIESYLHSMESVEGDLAEVALDHAQFVRMLSSRRALLKREYYIIVPAEYEKASDPTEALITAQLKLELRMEDLLQQLERMGLTGRRLTRAEIVTLYQSCFILQKVQPTPITNPMLEGINKPILSAADRGRTSGRPSRFLAETSIAEQEAELADLIRSLPGRQQDSKNQEWDSKLQELWSYVQFGKEDANEKQGWDPFSFFKSFMPKKPEKKTGLQRALPPFGELSDLVAPSSIQVFPSYLRIDSELDPEYCKTLALAHYPRSAFAGWLDRIIQIDQPNIDFSVHIIPHPPEIVSAQLGRKLTQLRGAMIVSQREGRSADPTTKVALEDVEHLRDNLARGDERVFSINVFIRVRARDLRTLTKQSNRIITKIRSLDFRALPTYWQHHLGLLCCLPDANNALIGTRLFGTKSAGTFFPFTGSDISMDDGVMFGVQASGGLIIIHL
jgi:hypothetical protein